MLNEAEIIHTLQTSFPTHIGDDAALIPALDGQLYVITKDLLLEDIHFRTTYFTPQDLAHKALHVNLSDIAAMGAKAKFILGGISIPSRLGQYAQDFLFSFTECCKKEGVILIGGDTTGSSDKLCISITAIGVVLMENVKYRSKANVGDYILVAGSLGSAHLGFIALEQQKNGFEEYKEAFLMPQALLKEGAWLGSKPQVSSLMDISDGLYTDLQKLCKASKVGANITLETIDLDETFIAACQMLTLDPTNSMLAGGEDYALLFTVNKQEYKELAEEFSKNFGYSLKLVGQIMKDLDVEVTRDDIKQKLNFKPFTHFREA